MAYACLTVRITIRTERILNSELESLIPVALQGYWAPPSEEPRG